MQGETVEREIILTLSRFQHIFVGDTKETNVDGKWDYEHTKYAVAATAANERSRVICGLDQRDKGGSSDLAKLYKEFTDREPLEYMEVENFPSNGAKNIKSFFRWK